MAAHVKQRLSIGIFVLSKNKRKNMYANFQSKIKGARYTRIKMVPCSQGYGSINSLLYAKLLVNEEFIKFHSNYCSI